MSTGQRVVYFAFIFLLASPAVPLAICWARLFMKPLEKTPRVLLVFLVLVTGSFVLVVGAIFVEGILGPHHSIQRHATIGANWLVSLIAAVVVATQSSNRVKNPLLLSASLLFLVWSLNAALSSLV